MLKTVATGDEILSDLDADTDYTCPVVMVNDFGESDAGQITLTTDPSGVLFIRLLHPATQT